MLESFNLVVLYPHKPHDGSIKTTAKLLEEPKNKDELTKSLREIAKVGKNHYHLLLKA